MGLDISAYSNASELVKPLVKVGDSYQWDDEMGDRDDVITIYSDHPARLDGKPEGYYLLTGDSMGFRAGSYSGYNAWRNWLALTMHGKSDEHFWGGFEERHKGEAIPFLELINFSDCEGAIGPVTSAKLAKDFAEHREKAAAAVECLVGLDRQYFLQNYDKWAKAFALAAQDGWVRFH